MGPSASRSISSNISTLARTSSATTTTTTTSPSSSPLKRKRSDELDEPALSRLTPETLFDTDEHLSIPPTVTLSMIEAAFEHDVVAVDAAFPLPGKIEPPSPVPTEIDEVQEVTQEKHTSLSITLGIKVKDYAFDGSSRSKRAPEAWLNPVQALILHDMYIRTSSERRETFRLPGKTLWRLLQIGWVTQEEAERNWGDADWEAFEQYAADSAYPFIFPKVLKKPSKNYRAALRWQMYGEPRDGNIPEDQVYMSEDGPDVDDGPPTPSDESTDDENSQLTHHSKKRRVNEEDTPIATPSSTPSSAETSIISQPSQSASSPTSTPPSSESSAVARPLAREISEPNLSRPATPPAAEEKEPVPATTLRTLGRSQTLLMVR